MEIHSENSENRESLKIANNSFPILPDSLFAFVNMFLMPNMQWFQNRGMNSVRDGKGRKLIRIREMRTAKETIDSLSLLCLIATISHLFEGISS